MKTLAALIIALYIFTSAFSETIIPGGYVSGTWNLEGSPYIIRGDIAIDETSTLTIEPGVEVLFQGYYRLLCEGQLLASGTENDSILFTAEDTTEGWDGIDFVDLDYNSLDSSRLEYCEISYGKASRFIDFRHGGALHLRYSSKVSINQCLITNNRTVDAYGANGAPGATAGANGFPGQSGVSGDGGALYCYNSNPEITNNIFSYNHTGNACGGNGGNGASHLSFTGSAAGGDGGYGGSAETGNGGAIHCAHSAPTIFGNRFLGNYTGSGTGGNGGEGGWAESTVGGMVSTTGGEGGNAGNGNAGLGGAIFLVFSDVICFNNLFVNNSTGEGTGGNGGDGGNGYWSGGQYGVGGNGGDGGDGIGGDGSCLYFYSNPTMNNNTITNSSNGPGTAGQGGTGGIGNWSSGSTGQEGEGSSGTAVIYSGFASNQVSVNSIIYNNSDSMIIGSHQITYSCVEGGYPGIGNISADPIFVNCPLGGYFLSQTAAGQTVQSPCVDAGHPDSTFIDGTTRTDGIPDEGIADMGFHHPPALTGPILTITPESLEFFAIENGINPDDQTLQIMNYGIGIFNYTITENIEWLSVSSNAGGPIPPFDTVFVSVDISGMMFGTYEGEITVTAPGAVGSPSVLTVILYLFQPVLSLSADTLIFDINGFNPMEQELVITNAGTGTYNYFLYENLDWLNITPMNGGPVPPTDTVLVSVDTAGLSPGAYEGQIIVTAPNALNSPDTIDVSMTINENLLSGSLAGTLIGGTTYSVGADIYVPEGESLFIEPGANLIFMDDFSFDIYGLIRAIGVEGDSINFFPDSTILNWGGIGFISGSSDSSRLEYCNIRDCHSSGIYMDNSNPFIYRCTISDNWSSSPGNGGGIYITYSNPIISNCIINNNSTYGKGGGSFISHSNPIISNCTFSGNTVLGIYSRGGGIYLSESNPSLDNCDISGNWAPYGGGLCIYRSDPQISNCTISENSVDNSGGGIEIFDNSDPIVRNCEVSRNFANENGGGIMSSFFSSNPIIINCTITDNFAGENGGGINCYYFNCINIMNTIVEGNTGNGGIYFDNSPNSILTYSDFHNNQNGNFTGNVPPDLGIITATNLNGDSCDIFSNIYIDPLFVDPVNGDYHLQNNSPCIDAGDPESPFDPDGTIADIGAFYLHQTVGVSEKPESNIPKEFTLHQPYPNPFNAETNLTFDLPSPGHVSLVIYDIQGREVARLIDGFRLAAIYEMSFNASELSSGVYFARLTAGDFHQTQKLLLIK